MYYNMDNVPSQNSSVIRISGILIYTLVHLSGVHCISSFISLTHNFEELEPFVCNLLKQLKLGYMVLNILDDAIY